MSCLVGLELPLLKCIRHVFDCVLYGIDLVLPEKTSIFVLVLFTNHRDIFGAQCPRISNHIETATVAYKHLNKCVNIGDHRFSLPYCARAVCVVCCRSVSFVLHYGYTIRRDNKKVGRRGALGYEPHKDPPPVHRHLGNTISTKYATWCLINNNAS